MVMHNVTSPAFLDVLYNQEVLPAEVIQMTNDETTDRILGGANRKEYNYDLKGIKITVVSSDDSSPYDPYLIVRPKEGDKRLDIVLNVNHPYWVEMADNNTRLHFLLNCLYDGVSEWKAEFLLKQLDPDTIKMIKDSLLRLPLSEE